MSAPAPKVRMVVAPWWYQWMAARNRRPHKPDPAFVRFMLYIAVQPEPE